MVSRSVPTASLAPSRPPTAGYETAAVIRRPVPEVFAYLSDLRSELEWNPAAQRIEKLTDRPVGVGTRFEAEWRNAPRTIVEVTRYEPPDLWQTHSRSWGMEVLFTGTLTVEGEATRYTAHLDVSARGFARLLVPIAVRAMRRQDEQHMQRIVRALEAGRTAAEVPGRPRP